MKRLIAGMIAITALSWSLGAAAQVYGTNDNPYEVNPFASNMVLPQEPAPAAATAPNPSSTAQQPDSSGTQQASASSTGQEIKKEKQP